VFTWRDGSQNLLLIFPDGHKTLAHRRNAAEVWSEPCKEDTYYQGIEPRPTEEIKVLISGAFGEAL
jgi:hypothetical protein